MTWDSGDWHVEPTAKGWRAHNQTTRQTFEADSYEELQELLWASSAVFDLIDDEWTDE